MEDAEKLKIIADKYQQGLVLKEKQIAALTHIEKHKGDLLVNLPVGYGKSIIYHLLPALLKSDELPTPVIIVISPLNIIQKDQMTSLLDHGVSACRVNIKTCIEETTDDAEKQNYGADMDDTVQNIASGKYSIILCHPEAILNTAKGKELLSNERFKENVAAVVVDECHILEKW
ncbi:uncharacterized protein LOC130049739 [Ostrea edulis]|uniref:uncharacterized protein LOC130049739 n=1 Tax=Ostrea edulis TaxID=37623 RepID=UPI0024AFBE5C|nr:uncharacterized protein LOC130049739 [Ostrea edulis]